MGKETSHSQANTQERKPARKKRGSSLPGHSGFPGFERVWHVLLQGWLQKVKKIQKVLFPSVLHVGDHSFTCSFVCLSAHPPTCPFIYHPSSHPSIR